MTDEKEITLDRRKVVARILRERGDALLVTGLGSTTWDAAAAGDHDHNFYVWGAMGGATLLGLGLALAQPQRRVLGGTRGREKAKIGRRVGGGRGEKSGGRVYFKKKKNKK